MHLGIILLRNTRVLNQEEWIPAGGSGIKKAMVWNDGEDRKNGELTETESSN